MELNRDELYSLIVILHSEIDFLVGLTRSIFWMAYRDSVATLVKLGYVCSESNSITDKGRILIDSLSVSTIYNILNIQKWSTATDLEIRILLYFISKVNSISDLTCLLVSECDVVRILAKNRVEELSSG